MEEYKTCNVCGENKPISDFYEKRRTNQCRKCICEQYKVRRKPVVVEDGIEFGDGSKYIGPVKDGKRHGKGVYIFSDGIEEYGEWNKGVLVIDKG